jgi:hypothetical protein
MHLLEVPAGDKCMPRSISYAPIAHRDSTPDYETGIPNRLFRVRIVKYDPSIDPKSFTCGTKRVGSVNHPLKKTTSVRHAHGQLFVQMLARP